MIWYFLSFSYRVVRLTLSNRAALERLSPVFSRVWRSNAFSFSSSVYEERKARYEARIKAMEEYVTSENVCRSRMLLRYFGEKNEHNCGQCDVCLSHRATDALTENSFDFEELKKKISELLTQKPLTPVEIADKIEAEKESISEVIQYLLEEGEWKMQNGMIHISK